MKLHNELQNRQENFHGQIYSFTLQLFILKKEVR